MIPGDTVNISDRESATIFSAPRAFSTINRLIDAGRINFYRASSIGLRRHAGLTRLRAQTVEKNYIVRPPAHPFALSTPTGRSLARAVFHTAVKSIQSKIKRVRRTVKI